MSASPLQRNASGLALGLAMATSTLFASATQAQTLDIGVMGELASFDTSQVAGGVWESQVLMDVYEGLFKLAPDGELLPGMATDYQVSEDGRTYTFQLRDDARWSDGEPVTAEDFVTGWRHLLKPRNASKYAYMLYPVVNAEAVNRGDMPPEKLGVEALDEGRTLRVELEHSTPYFPQLLTHYTAYPLPTHLLEEHGSDWVDLEHIATNGAFTPVEWVSQSRISVEPNSQYYDAEQVSLERVNYHTSEDRNAALSRFRAGELDIVREYASERYQWLKENLPEATRMAPYLGSYYYVFNHRDGHPTSDARVREALSLAIRRKVLAEQLMQGTFEPAHAFVPPGVNHYEGLDEAPTAGKLEARMARARKLLQEAGYGPDNPLQLRLRYNSSEEHKRIAVAIAAMWRPLGVEVDLINAEATVHYQTIAEGDFDVARAGWVADYNDAENFLTLLKSGVGNNYGAYANPAFDALLEKAARTQDADARQALLEEAETLAMQDHAVAPLLYYVSRNLVNPALKGWQNNIEDDHPSRWISFEE
ncbi:peptide ABC transporter substrate-binding protein [Halomonas halmophila]|uniref:Peptide ABC transporter substrate-binding protein n=1 Tax=Halomonas halmophila TaxID=252 RepID=A0A4Y4F8M5_9GAMM|nr:peptide ABC transporter substrate-binding protein [Halomonas halmophila]GED23478.1 peptide ABC transporter substrate-binding protein [Halomonas halmophila]